jgi:hypothetical protein
VGPDVGDDGAEGWSLPVVGDAMDGTGDADGNEVGTARVGVGAAIVGISMVGAAEVGVVTADGAPTGESLPKLQKGYERMLVSDTKQNKCHIDRLVAMFSAVVRCARTW